MHSIADITRKPSRNIPPAIFGLTFFLMLSSCATMTQPDDRNVWDEAEETQPPVQQEIRAAQEPPPPTGLDLVPGADEEVPQDLVIGLPDAPRYQTGNRGRVRKAPETAQRFKPLPQTAEADSLPEHFTDDMDPASMKQAIANHLLVMEGVDLDQTVRLGNHQITYRRLKATLLAFDALLDQSLPPDEFDRQVREKFYVIPAGLGMHHRMVFTGYYTPVIPASTQWSPEFPYPLYRKPEPHQARIATHEKPRQTQRDYGFHLIATSRPLPLTREAIDGREVLKDKNLEVAWLQDDLERYFLHIQGSGYLRFPDGRMQAVQYMGSNDMPYASVGRMLIADGAITTGQGSMQGIKAYFKDHPESIPKYLFKNPRYIFFDRSNSKPRGSTGAELVPGRAIATDKRRYPGGGLVFISARKPVLDQHNEIDRWEPFSRFVLDQDTGSAIRGLGRADLYFGIGEEAGAKAGRYMERGKAFYLLLK